MMYAMKKINAYDEDITLPKCMYTIRKIVSFDKPNEPRGEEINLNIGKQVIKFLQAPNKLMADLEKRQDQLLHKLDVLYDRIKSISSICEAKTAPSAIKKMIDTPSEIVLSTSPENIPWFLTYVLKEISSSINFVWHIHSSVPTEKVAKIKAFVKHLNSSSNGSQTTVRLIFKTVSADAELKLSSLSVPIVGNVNILRYIVYVYPAIPYEDNYTVDALLDICHLMERTNEKNKESMIKNLFNQYDGWIYNKAFSIVDLAAYNVIKQWRNCPKFVPREWFEKCEKLSS